MRAFVLRQAPVGLDLVPDALATNEISIGWPLATGLLDEGTDYWAFRSVMKATYHSDEPGWAKSGAAASQVWRFIREMSVGDLIVVPHGASFHVAEVAGPVFYRSEYVDRHAAFRRSVRWLTADHPVPRATARAALQSRMKTYNTCADASDLVAEIRDAVGHGPASEAPSTGAAPSAPSFRSDLRRRLIDEARAEITAGRMDSYGFELLLVTVLRSLGASEVRVVPRSLDKGADIVATFSLAETFHIRLAVQAKHYRPDPPVGPQVIDQLVAGMEAEQASLGWVATSGSFSEAAQQRKDQIEEERGIQIELVDGDQLAAMIVEGGLRAVGFAEPTGDA